MNVVVFYIVSFEFSKDVQYTRTTHAPSGLPLVNYRLTPLVVTAE